MITVGDFRGEHRTVIMVKGDLYVVLDREPLANNYVATICLTDFEYVEWNEDTPVDDDHVGKLVRTEVMVNFAFPGRAYREKVWREYPENDEDDE